MNISKLTAAAASTRMGDMNVDNATIANPITTDIFLENDMLMMY